MNPSEGVGLKPLLTSSICSPGVFMRTLPPTAALPLNRRHWMLGTAAGLLGAGAAQAADAPMPIFDAHLHYSHDAWERLPPKEAVALLRKAGLKRAMVSSSSDDGTQMLFREAT
jgi:hypothetical protein